MPSLASGLQRCSPWETFGITTAASLLGFLSMCAPLQQRKPADGIEKAYNTGYSGNTAGCEHGFWRDAAISTTWTDDYRGHPSKGQTSARSLLVHFARGNPTMLPCSAAPCSEDMLANYEFPASVLGKQLYPLSTGLLTTNSAKPTQKFSWMTGIYPDHAAWAPGCTSDVFSQAISKVRLALPNSERHRVDAKRRWVSIDLASARLDCLLHALGAAVSKTCSQTIQFPPCFGIAVFRSLV